MVVFGAAFKLEDHPLSEEGKHVNVKLISQRSVLIYLFPPSPQEVAFVVCSKHLNAAWRV